MSQAAYALSHLVRRGFASSLARVPEAREGLLSLSLQAEMCMYPPSAAFSFARTLHTRKVTKFRKARLEQEIYDIEFLIKAP